MNAPAKFDLEGTATPDDLDIVVRDRRFLRGAAPRRWWLNGDPVATAWFNALSATFPRGEAFFVDSVKACRDGASPRLAAEIRAFVRQEINHTREHIVLNRLAEASGYDVAFIDRRVEELLALTKGRPAEVNLAATMALEHFTAMFGKELLDNPVHLHGAEGDLGEIWRWHSVEEIEHKGVAYDTWLHATRDWSRWRRWKVKSLLMLIVSRRFVFHRVRDMQDLLAQDGLTGWKWKAKIWAYLLGRPGFLRRIALPWLAYFLPGFHPWNEDDRHLIAKYEGDFADALLPSA
ncbi:metal-dependent hydrolase [Altererythrobacter aerius]|uniref:Metal-dependent hydrolase n=1 Tax=Tsuneonella aeria TaxID=1837929 RepID=A0A6I4TI18_9SPHN|nr:metal-dependent hydrolase [Tsuneonella aeria]MXO76247.1 metal-dependent hydrolase [Tsuneonella aeria]